MAALATTIFVAATTLAQAQNNDPPSNATGLPKSCVDAAKSGGAMMSNMDEGKSQSMMAGMQGGNDMTETQKGLRAAMMKMEPAMMLGMMAKDADVAWICAMIPHHQGAIDMARAGLKGATDPQSRQMAEETIKMQEKEIAKLTAWVDKNAASETRKETTGSNLKK
ncbi:DUF305 domain-containing protein [Xanthobacteraceae bacterium Astr-EGSB]|uniref:DUF305 domain-containing protein n=1 Tax=Astrobacterium formosum TaxID=3069710 RepID=UPI0027B1D29F|nr:DUF305 domain-containing protein [Xanthobacteraceae bacterium Astr-EGSB]